MRYRTSTEFPFISKGVYDYLSFIDVYISFLVKIAMLSNQNPHTNKNIIPKAESKKAKQNKHIYHTVDVKRCSFVICIVLYNCIFYKNELFVDSVSGVD